MSQRTNDHPSGQHSHVLTEPHVIPVVVAGMVVIAIPLGILAVVHAPSEKPATWSPAMILMMATLGLAEIHMVVAVVRRVAVWWSRGSRSLEHEGALLEQGGCVQVVLTASRAPRQAALLRCTLSCEEHFGTHSEGSTWTSIRWRHPWCVPLSAGRRSRTGWRLPLTLPVPSDLPATNPTEEPVVRWILDVQAVSPRANDRATFTIPVGAPATPDRTLTAASLSEDALPQPAIQAVLALQVANVEARPAGDGLVMVNPLGEDIRPIGFLLHVLAISLAFLLVMAELAFTDHHGPSVGGLVMCGFFGLFTFFAFVMVARAALTINRTTVTSAGIRREQGIIRPRTTWFLTPEDIRSITIAPEEHSVGGCQWCLILTRSNGQSEPLTRTVGPEQEAARIAADLCRVVGMQSPLGAA